MTPRSGIGKIQLIADDSSKSVPLCALGLPSMPPEEGEKVIPLKTRHREIAITTA